MVCGFFFPVSCQPGRFATLLQENAADHSGGGMTDVFVGQIMMTGFGFAQRGFAQCNGQIMAIQQNQALFSNCTKLTYRTFACLVSHGPLATRPLHFFTSEHSGLGGPNASSPEIFARIL